MALKRLSLGQRSTVPLTVPRRNGAGEAIKSVRLYLLSDSYLGLDHTYEVTLVGLGGSAKVTAPPRPLSGGAAPAPAERERPWQRRIRDDGDSEGLLVQEAAGSTAGRSDTVPGSSSQSRPPILRGRMAIADDASAAGGRSTPDRRRAQDDEDEPPCG
jgi:hypothetical protein